MAGKDPTVRPPAILPWSFSTLFFVDFEGQFSRYTHRDSDFTAAKRSVCESENVKTLLQEPEVSGALRPKRMLPLGKGTSG